MNHQQQRNIADWIGLTSKMAEGMPEGTNEAALQEGALPPEAAVAAPEGEALDPELEAAMDNLTDEELVQLAVQIQAAGGAPEMGEEIPPEMGEEIPPEMGGGAAPPEMGSPPPEMGQGPPQAGPQAGPPAEGGGPPPKKDKGEDKGEDKDKDSPKEKEKEAASLEEQLKVASAVSAWDTFRGEAIAHGFYGELRRLRDADARGPGHYKAAMSQPVESRFFNAIHRAIAPRG